MALKLIGAGFGRTGTLSVYTALGQLGLRSYHMLELLNNPANHRHMKFWRDVARSAPGIQYDWERVFSNYDASVDNPGCCVWQELAQAYPQAKVLLTLHPKGAETWYESTWQTIYFTERMWQFKVLKWFTPFGRAFGEMSSRLIWQRSHHNTMGDRAAAIARYHAHIEEVKAAIPAERLLVYSVDQGWAPLCEFLGLPQPDAPFPQTNDRAQMSRMIKTVARGAYLILAVLAALAALLAFGLYWSLS